MGWEQALRQRLLDDAAVAGLVGVHPDDGGKSIEWTVRRQGAPLPAVLLQVVSDPRPQTHDGFDSIRTARVRVSVLAATRHEVMVLREAVIVALAEAGDFGGVWFDRARIELVFDAGGPSETGFIHRDSIDFNIWHKG